jgi:hypothetical protein
MPSRPPPHRPIERLRTPADLRGPGHRNRLSTSAANAPRTAVDRRPELQKSPGRQPTSRRSAPLRGSAKVAQLGRYARFLSHRLPPEVDETTCEEKRLSRNTPVWTRPQWSVSLPAVDETTCEEKRLSRNTPVWTRPQWSVSLPKSNKAISAMNLRSIVYEEKKERLKYIFICECVCV